MGSKSIQIIIFLSILPLGCKTYYISIDSFKSQLRNVGQKNREVATTRGPLGGLYVYPANLVRYIECTDKQGNPFLLPNSPSIEIRFTDKKNKKTVFYFDTVFLSDSLIVGDRSRFIGAQKAIPINNIKLIEIQDGHKDFKTANPK